MADWLRENLACPIDGRALDWQSHEVRCTEEHRFPVIDGIPIMLRRDQTQTLWVADEAIAQGEGTRPLRAPIAHSGSPEVDWYVQDQVPGTCGCLYKPLQGRLQEYPIPSLRLEARPNARLLDIGANWGRWSIAAAQQGYSPVALDVSLDAAYACRRIAAQFGVTITQVVGDARFLPFNDHCFDTVFSYSVLQHFAKADAEAAIKEAGRVLKPGGESLVQLPNRFGVRSMYHLARRGRKEPDPFDVRYWAPKEMLGAFSRGVGPSSIEVDGFFGLGIQPSDIPLMPRRYKVVIKASETLRKATRVLRPLSLVADSLYVRSIKSR